ncbi:MAG: DMT family transporter [Candidatus Hermodarchaeota archaeon]
MENYNLKKGIIYASICIFTIGLQPVISNARPDVIDPYLFGAITALFEALLLFPIFFLENAKLKRSLKNDPLIDKKILSLLHGWKKKSNIRVIIIIGITFSAVPVMLYIGYELAQGILSSLTMKSEIIFALIFGYLILKEKINKIQVFFCFLLFFGLIIAITGGSFNLFEFNLGVIILLISAALFTFVHTLTKVSFERDELYPSQVVFVRNLLSGIILFIIYISFFPLSNLLIIFEPVNFAFFVIMSVDYGLSLYLWYKALTYIEIGKASIIISLTPIISSVFSFLVLGEPFTVFHLIGMIIIIFSIIMIVRVKTNR